VFIFRSRGRPVGTHRTAKPGAQVDRPARPDVSDPAEHFDGRTFDDEALLAGLEAFGGDAAERRAVARHARDLADSGRYVDDTGIELTAEHVVVQLADAREGTPADRWNWWIGSVELAYGGYAEFQIRGF